MEIDENLNEIFVPVPNNPLHQAHNQVYKHWARDVMEKDVHPLNRMGSTMLSASSSLMDMMLPSSSIIDAGPTQPKHFNQVMVGASTLQEVNALAEKSNFKASIGSNTSLITSIMPAVARHVTWKTPEVESVSVITQTRVQSESLSLQPPFKLADYSAEDYCFSDDIGVKGTQGTAILPVRESKTTIVAFTPRQRASTHGAHITRTNLARLLKYSSAQESMQGVTGNSHIMLNATLPTMEGRVTMSFRIGRTLGPPISGVPCQSSQSAIGHFGTDFIEHQASDYHNNPVPLLVNAVPTPPHREYGLEIAMVPDEAEVGNHTVGEGNKEKENPEERSQRSLSQIFASPPVLTTAKSEAPISGLKKAIQLQVSKRSESRRQDWKVVVGKRKRDGEGAVVMQPVLLRKETPDKRQMTMRLTDSNLVASLDVSSSDQHAQPWASGAFIPRNRRLSLNSSNPEPPRHPRRIKFLTLPMVIEWKTQLDRINYLYEQEKISQADVDKLEEVLLVVRANMDHPFLTADWVKQAKMVMGLKEFRHKGKGVFTLTSKRAAREIFNFWKDSPKFGMACM